MFLGLQTLREGLTFRPLLIAIGMSSSRQSAAASSVLTGELESLRAPASSLE